MTFEEIQKLIKQVNQSNITKLNLDFDGGHIDIDKKQAIASNDDVVVAKSVVPAPAATKISLPQIKAPLVGIVYLQANPDKPQYKKVGDHVAKGDVVCVIEAMKMMTEVKSDVSGTISEILVTNEEVVEYDQPLFTVQPD
ncbi:acetyl-CoA carboxylase biotin carboxyl carrier protein subunit [Lactobacillus sp. ESL0679]|uniref:acetyl-CoA carboxylase biotin carboxyl carrier protein n=1 Tax=Lactobacillus sp. ESL0679 TaxID=2983209 RepID=UPI0023F92BCF|nr:biotin/lipoyl-containing protein [Lactobacillus sp. ESL0679]MDF7682899.1 acetyl-CoA carboxylase biotin carboxyl carrier protein subunit [Lactobacillus sp. ESL0679]